MTDMDVIHQISRITFNIFEAIFSQLRSDRFKLRCDCIKYFPLTPKVTFQKEVIVLNNLERKFRVASRVFVGNSSCRRIFLNDLEKSFGKFYYFKIEPFAIGFYV